MNFQNILSSITWSPSGYIFFLDIDLLLYIKYLLPELLCYLMLILCLIGTQNFEVHLQGSNVEGPG